MTTPQHDAAPKAAPDEKTHFGFEQVPESEKAQRVRGVFSSVARK